MSRIGFFTLFMVTVIGCDTASSTHPPDAAAFLPDAAPPDAPGPDATEPDAGPADATPQDASSPMDATPDGAAHMTARVRVHIISSEVDALDAASIYSTEALERFLEHINDTFDQAGVRWEIESVRMQPALNEEAYLDAIAAESTGAAPLRMNIDPTQMLAPEGWDVFVVRQTYQLGFGGVYVCSVNREPGMGAMFVPLLDRAGAPQQARKWSHEFGHATGLPHTPCEPSYAENLMMSGSCEHREMERRTLSSVQVSRILEQLVIGGPALCGTVTLPES